MVTTAQIRATTEARSGTQYGVLGPKAHAVWDPNGWEDRTRSYHRQRRRRPTRKAAAAAAAGVGDAPTADAAARGTENTAGPRGTMSPTVW